MRRTAHRIAERLKGQLATIEEARRPPHEGGVPEADGFYAWWVEEGIAPEIPAPPHPTSTDWGLLYVGISPRDERSRQNIRARVLTNHVGGNTGSSTFRFVLAALLMDNLGLTPRRSAAKVVLSREDNERLRDWQRKHLRLTWCESPNPWEAEPAVIRALEPPLNSSGNEAHPIHATVARRRAAFRSAAT